MKKIQNKQLKKGFTLVELIVVIAIVAILTAVSIAGYYGFMAYANQSAADQEAKQFKDSIVGQFSLNYSAKTSQNAGVYGTVNKNGLRLSKSTGDNPSDYATSILAEAFTYSENPAIFNSEAVFDFSQTSLLIFDGSETDGIKPSLLSPKMLKVEDDYFITEVTYQSKNTFKSTVKFTDLEGQEVAPSKPIDMSKTPSALTNVEGFKESYAANEVVDFSNVKATVVFTDGSSAVVGAESLEITETTGSALHHRAPSGNRTFTISYRHGQDAEPVVAPTYSAPKTEPISESSITEIKLPTNVQQFKRTLEISPDSPAGFKKDTSEDAGYFFVGNQNLFKFKIDVICIDNRGHITRIDPKTMDGIVYKLDETILDYDKENDGLDLSAVAEGHYVLTVTSGTRSVSLNIKVIDAWNVYTAQDLKMFDNTRPNCYDYTTNGQERVDTFNTYPILKTYTTPYLKMNGTNDDVVGTLDNDYANLAHGIVLQNSIKIKPSLFDRHIYNQFGKLVRDRQSDLGGNSTVHLFKRHINVGEQFYFEGNYFTIDASSMPYQDLVHDGSEKGFWPELFAFAHDYERDSHGNHDVHGNRSWYGAHVERMNVIGNGGKVDNLDAAGSLIIFNNKNAKTCEFNYVNISKGNYGLNTYQNSYEMIVNSCKISNCFTTTVANDGCGHRTHMARVIAAKGGVYTSSSDTVTKYDPRVSGLNNDSDIELRIASTDAHAGLRIYNSVLRDAGGPAVVLEATGAKSRSEGWDSFPTIDVDEKTEITSYITGSEPFFVVQELSQSVGKVEELDGALSLLTSNKFTVAKKGFYNCKISLTAQGRKLYVQATDRKAFTDDADLVRYASGTYAENMEVNIAGTKYIDFNNYISNTLSFLPTSLGLMSEGTAEHGSTELMIDMSKANNPVQLAATSVMKGDLEARMNALIDLGYNEMEAKGTLIQDFLLPGSQTLGLELGEMCLVMGLFNK